MKPVRVLWLVKGLGRGGAEQLLLNCARQVDRSRFEVEVAYILPWKDALAPALERTGIRVHCLGTGHTSRWPLRLRRLLTDRQYALIHSHLPIPAVAARLLTGRGGPRLVHTEHNVWKRYRTPTRWANALTYRRNDAVIAVSHAVARSVPNVWRRPDPWLTVLHHGPDMTGAPSNPAARRAAGKEVRRMFGVPRDALVVGSVANFTAKKDQRTLLLAHAALRRSHPNTVLMLIGTGPLRRDLSRQAAQLNLSDSVVFTGSRPDVPVLLSAFDIFSLSSAQEGLPVALMEAMTSGLPTVATSVGGIPEILDDGEQGLLVPPGDPDALAAALGRLAADQELRRRLGQAAEDRARSFDAAGTQRAVELVYQRVLQRGRTQSRTGE